MIDDNDGADVDEAIASLAKDYPHLRWDSPELRASALDVVKRFKPTAGVVPVRQEKKMEDQNDSDRVSTGDDPRVRALRIRLSEELAPFGIRLFDEPPDPTNRHAHNARIPELGCWIGTMPYSRLTNTTAATNLSNGDPLVTSALSGALRRMPFVGAVVQFFPARADTLLDVRRKYPAVVLECDPSGFCSLLVWARQAHRSAMQVDRAGVHPAWSTPTAEAGCSYWRWPV